jgi:hypothetical protein
VSVPPHAADPANIHPTPKVDAGRLWVGGLATASVAALAPTSEGTLGDANTAGLAGLAAAAALLATGLMHLLLVSTPRPGQFFSWIMVLATIIAAILPFMTDAEQNTKIATAAIYVAIGATIASLISSVARSAIRVRRANPPMAGS